MRKACGEESADLRETGRLESRDGSLQGQRLLGLGKWANERRADRLLTRPAGGCFPSPQLRFGLGLRADRLEISRTLIRRLPSCIVGDINLMTNGLCNSSDGQNSGRIEGILLVLSCN
jgi:hypothetical protein